YDPYNAKEFVERWASENGPFGIEKVIQGAKTEYVPLGELKKLSEERMLLFDEDLMIQGVYIQEHEGRKAVWCNVIKQ
ncbi:MAG: hypothetical protein KHZ57_32050, partial [Hungatella hathewayi]|nr:hypothetical protein [Hungatella hathewayi]